ncbi:hypothetical protein GOBAR_AA39843 [Gossypium barbadense]|uniref:Uncharacterized protein n=1 Tax=Gossypium barbadense TaxID=3634 RepID=A0A2P5VPV8_GOSBA|nr:hypothetical protein GOBAR_AA39843 [Gossypium barbadense]
MQPRIVDNAISSLSIENAFQELDSFLNQSTNPVRNIECEKGLNVVYFSPYLQGYHEVDSLEKGLNVDPDLLSQPFFDVGNFLLRQQYNDLTEGSGDVRANQDDMKLSTVQGHADVQRIIMNSLAEVYHKLESNPEILELKVITTMEAMVQNIMNKLMKAREMEYEAEEKRFEKKKANVRKDKLKLEKDEADLKEKKLKLDQDEADLKEKKLKLDQDEAELKENQLKLASLPKKPRVE